MSCICKPCNKIDISCSTGIDCGCFPCVRPDTATLDLQITDYCEWYYYTNNCNFNNPGFYQYCIQNCDVQGRYNIYYNGTYVLDKISRAAYLQLYLPPLHNLPTDCDDFLYSTIGEDQYFITYSPICSGTVCITPLIRIMASFNYLTIEYYPLERLPCGSNMQCPNYGLSANNTTITYHRNTSVPCSETSIVYKLYSFEHCIRFPPTLTLILNP